MADLVAKIGAALLMAAGMAWQVGWSLVLGFFISGVLQVAISRQRLTAALGRDGLREVVLATAAGAASSSCSYAAISVSRTLFRKGAALVPALAFIFASTNLVVELGIVLFLLMGWQFAAGEWIGGVVLVAIMSGLVRLTYPAKWVAEARAMAPAQPAHAHGAAAGGQDGFWAVLARRDSWIAIAQSFAMDWAMLWKDVVLGFVIAGALAAFVPAGVWGAVFVKGANPWLQVPANALLGPLVAALTFVCSIGNVPMAAVLWGSGVSFGGVLAFLYADLVVLPVLDAMRRSFGWKLAAYIGAVFYATMAATAMIMDVAFRAAGLIPARRTDIRATMVHFSLNYTFWLNAAFGVLAIALFVLSRRAPVPAGPCEHHAHQH